MDRPPLAVADIVRRDGAAYQATTVVSSAQRRVMLAISRCRTAALGGHVEQCDRCGHRRVWYNSCRDRHCPSCQGLARAAWIDRRAAELLDCEYFHVVFTVPAAIAAIALQNKAVVYGILFRAAARTLRTIAADPRHLGAAIGFFAVLHTWGQTLVHHPHLHCVVPGGGLAPDGTRWVACRPGFFLPVRVLSRLFRRLFLRELQTAFDTGQLHGAGSLATAAGFAAHLAAARRTEWVVYAKRPFAGPPQVLDYVGRYTHRVAIANQRLLSAPAGQVRFRYTDYRAGPGRLPGSLCGADRAVVASMSSLPGGPDAPHRVGAASLGAAADSRYLVMSIPRPLVARLGSTPPRDPSTCHQDFSAVQPVPRSPAFDARRRDLSVTSHPTPRRPRLGRCNPHRRAAE